MDGKGSMEGVLLKIIPLFNQKGEAMDKGCLNISLSESLFNPGALFSGMISFESIDDNHFKAIAEKNGIRVTGIFEINDKGEMIEYRTEDRPNVTSDGKLRNIPWIAKCSDYKEDSDGIKRPGRLQAIWIFENCEFKYFDGSNMTFKVE